MSVGRDYLLRKPTAPSAPKVFFDTQIVPLAVNTAGGLEVVLDRASVRLGLRPAVFVIGVAGIASFGLYRALRRRRAAGGR